MLEHLQWNEREFELFADAHLVACGYDVRESSLANRLAEHECMTGCEMLFEFSHKVPSSAVSTLETTAILANEEHLNNFPFFMNEQFKIDLIKEWQKRMHPAVVSSLLCVVCAQRCK